jgi:hypothetical protein
MSMTPIFQKTLVRSVHVRSFAITVDAVAGWEIFEREDERVVCRQRYTDWHRVERVAQRLSRVVADLQREGWQERPA